MKEVTRIQIKIKNNRNNLKAIQILFNKRPKHRYRLLSPLKISWISWIPMPVYNNKMQMLKSLLGKSIRTLLKILIFYQLRTNRIFNNQLFLNSRMKKQMAKTKILIKVTDLLRKICQLKKIRYQFMKIILGKHNIHKQYNRDKYKMKILHSKNKMQAICSQIIQRVPLIKMRIKWTTLFKISIIHKK